MDLTPQLEGEATEKGEAGALEVFHPGVSADEPPSSIVVAEALRCQVKITTRRSLHLRIANHTARDVYVRLVGHGGHVADINTGLPRNTLEQSKTGFTNLLTNNNKPLPSSPCASMLPSPADDSQRGVDLLFSSPVQSPAKLLRELHADPEIQAQLEAERERDRAYERTRLAARGRTGGVLSSSLRLLSSNHRVNACVLSAARLVAVLMGVLLVTVPTLLLLLESDMDVSFLHDIRQTPEFEQFHFEYYCPLRRWVLCKISLVLENLWSD
uniref:FERM domain containing 3 n=1 Tax=Mola mola TaxID=94237 RepID=A0A3Q3VPM3_MOLML